jgi:hypothetical protein
MHNWNNEDPSGKTDRGFQTFQTKVFSVGFAQPLFYPIQKAPTFCL